MHTWMGVSFAPEELTLKLVCREPPVPAPALHAQLPLDAPLESCRPWCRTGSAQVDTVSGSASLIALIASTMEVIYVLFGVGSPSTGVVDKPAPPELFAGLPPA